MNLGLCVVRGRGEEDRRAGRLKFWRGACSLGFGRSMKGGGCCFGLGEV